MNFIGSFIAPLKSSPPPESHEVGLENVPAIHSTTPVGRHPISLLADTALRTQEIVDASRSVVKPVASDAPLLASLARLSVPGEDRADQVARRVGVKRRALQSAFRTAHDAPPSEADLIERAAQELGLDVDDLREAMRATGMTLFDQRV